MQVPNPTYRFSYKLNAYYARTQIINGVRKEQGEEIAGLFVFGDNIIDPETGEKPKNVTELLKIVNKEWKSFYPGQLKDVTVKEEGLVLYQHSNYRVSNNRFNSSKKLVR